MKARSIGPALLSGRIGDFAVNPDNHSEWFVAVSSGGVWKTVNNGTTFTPVFDSQGSFSIGCVEIDPSNHNTVWVGTGENNSQRSVSFGDGVYKSVDGGKSWKNMGLKDTEHIGMIVIHPDNSDIVYVAAQGPLWRSGGERGLYRTTDGGKAWTRILDISDDTGINEIHMDPRDPDVLYASAYQRRRHVWTLIDGGPESGIHKSTDGGETWREINRGLPGGDKGRIGIDISPANPDVLYAIVEAKKGKGGFYRSTDRGETWVRRNSYMTSSPQYYNEIKCDPVDVDRVYVFDTRLQVSDDGGATFTSAQGRDRHVDNHALWIDPGDTSHMIVGCDGGVYETFDRASTWQYKPNLPITQFYRVTVDNSEPFYKVYGGTQDNNTLGGPSRTTHRSITNEDWFVTVGGDGFETQVDPENPNIVYSQWQYGGLVRHDRLSGENVDIKPQPKPGEDPYVFNWDAPLLISPHSHTRLYFGGRRLYRSDDRGNSWRAISGDLSRGIDRNELEVMGRIQPLDAVARHMSTSIYGNAVALSESPLVEDLIYVGTDDGLIHVTDDGGENWRTIEVFPSVPDRAYVSSITASRHDADTVYASFDNHKQGDFRPYLLRSTDRGRTWESISGDLGDRDIAYSIAEDHVRPELLFVGTEFGAYYTMNGGDEWLKIGGLPTIAVRDVDIQRRENDLAFATFGRSFYIVDDYSPLQVVSNEALDADAHVFAIKDALLYVPTGRGRGSQGSMYFTSSNPPFGAVITYHLKKDIDDKPERDKDSGTPDFEQIREDERRRSPSVILTIRDEDGQIVRRLKGSTGKGVHRTSWDLRLVSRGPYALPGTYTVTISKEADGEATDLSEPVSFEVVALELGTFQPEDREEVRAF
ncbi:MAG: glycosyl hydrolase, partial [Planctomycetes bacterium]|nr:glycosyl hydrolase [Planctomycetota bacterium]